MWTPEPTHQPAAPGRWDIFKDSRAPSPFVPVESPVLWLQLGESLCSLVAVFELLVCGAQGIGTMSRHCCCRTYCCCNMGIFIYLFFLQFGVVSVSLIRVGDCLLGEGWNLSVTEGETWKSGKTEKKGNLVFVELLRDYFNIWTRSRFINSDLHSTDRKYAEV